MLLRMTAVVVTALLVMVFFIPAADAVILPTGSWFAVANGVTGALVVTGVDGSGNLIATFLGDPVTGFYSATSDTITFLRQGSGGLSTHQFYVGRLMTLPAGPGQTTYLLTGNFNAFAGTGATVGRQAFAWAAIITAP